MTLLEKALAVTIRQRPKQKLTGEQLDLVIEFAAGRVRASQIAVAVGKTSATTHALMQAWLMNAVRNGQVTVTLTEKKNA